MGRIGFGRPLPILAAAQASSIPVSSAAAQSTVMGAVSSSVQQQSQASATAQSTSRPAQSTSAVVVTVVYTASGIAQTTLSTKEGKSHTGTASSSTGTGAGAAKADIAIGVVGVALITAVAGFLLFRRRCQNNAIFSEMPPTTAHNTPRSRKKMEAGAPPAGGQHYTPPTEKPSYAELGGQSSASSYAKPATPPHDVKYQ